MKNSGKSGKGHKKKATTTSSEYNKELEGDGLTNDNDIHTTNTLLSESLLADMLKVVEIFNQLISLTKSPCLSMKNFNILIVAIKEGKKFTEVFMKSEKLIGALFATNTPKTMKVVSQLQKATRQLHTLCSHGKHHKNSQITAEIPTIRKMLETIIVQMKTLGIVLSFECVLIYVYIYICVCVCMFVYH